MDNQLIDGDALNPTDNDLIAQQQRWPVGRALPEGGWRILTGNFETSLIARVAFRFETETD